jgi:integrase/recombinase XerD
VEASILLCWTGRDVKSKQRNEEPDLHADMALKERALARTTPPNTAATRYQAPDNLIAFLDYL